jgi:signal transduction histidine kinase
MQTESQSRPQLEPSKVHPIQRATGSFSSESVLNILKLIFAGAPLREVLNVIAQLAETQGEGMLCAIFLLDENGKYVRCAAAPNIPGLASRVGGIPIGPKAASCGTAIYRREPVYVTDILSDPLWDDYRHLLSPLGLRAVWARPLLSSEGKVLGTFANYYREVRSPSPADLTSIENASHIAGIAIERHLNEEHLRRSEAFLAETQRLTRIGSFSWRVATDEFTWSEELYRIFEFDPALPVTLDLVATRVHPQDLPLLSDTVDGARRALTDFEYEFRINMPDDSVKYLHLIARGSRASDGELEYIGAVQDVTQRRLSEGALSRARAELARVARVTSLGVLTASIAHEVNQPLSGIITNASTCLRMLSAVPPNVDGARETAQRTIRDGNRASDVVKRLRTMYSKKELSPESMDMTEATREVIALSMSELQRDGVNLRYDLAYDLPTIMGDRIQLQQVILNLLRNATEAMRTIDDRPRELFIRTERHEQNHVLLSVKDSGVGLTAQAAERIFEAFYTTKTDGMGIGLSISRSIIEAHQGRLWAVPNDGPGATFLLALPFSQDGLANADNSSAVASMKSDAA